jgi:superfamily I DNA/RNA helicase
METVSVMTMHAAKGLEFTAVFIPGCEDKIIPYALYPDKKSDFNEEKRLMYVAMTRAKKNLFLSRAGSRFINNQKFSLEKSPFLEMIESELVDRENSGHTKKEKTEQLKLF